MLISGAPPQISHAFYIIPSFLKFYRLLLSTCQSTIYLHSFTDSSIDVQYKHQPLDGENDAYKCEVTALRTEMKHYTEQVEKLSCEFKAVKREVEAAR